MANRVTSYKQAFMFVIGIPIDDKAQKFITDIEQEGHTEKSVCFAIWKTQDKLIAFKNDARFWNILKNEVNKWSWKKDDPRWDDYWDRKNEQKRAVTIRREIDNARQQELLAKVKPDDKRYKGYVYFVQGQCGGAIKIGYSCNPEKRLKELQTGYPDTLVIIHMIKGNERIERLLHKEFECCKLKGEWFRPDKILIDKIKELSV